MTKKSGACEVAGYAVELRERHWYARVVAALAVILDGRKQQSPACLEFRKLDAKPLDAFAEPPRAEVARQQVLGALRASRPAAAPKRRVKKTAKRRFPTSHAERGWAGAVAALDGHVFATG